MNTREDREKRELALALIRDREWDTAAAVASDIQEPDLRDEAFSYLVCGLIRHGELERALRLADLVSTESGDGYYFREVNEAFGAAFAKAGELDLCRAHLARAEAAMGSLDDADPSRAHVYCDIAIIYELGGWRDDAVRCIEQAVRLVVAWDNKAGFKDPDTSKALVRVTQLLVRWGEIQRARDVAARLTPGVFADMAAQAIREAIVPPPVPN